MCVTNFWHKPQVACKKRQYFKIQNPKSKIIPLQKVLITGAAGFIGSHLCHRLLQEEWQVIGVDHMTDRPNEKLKRDRVASLSSNDRFTMIEQDLSDAEGVLALFEDHSFDVVIHLAAQTGVRDSLQRTKAYVRDNLVGFTHVLEAASEQEVDHFLYASSSSIYGANTSQPYSVHNDANHPISFYAATKKSNEMLAHSYAHLTGMPVSGLRFFTVYGPWGRPDMAYYHFARKIKNGEPITVYNKGDMFRDFTYVDDIVEAVTRLIDHPPEADPGWNSDDPDPATSSAPYRIYNVGNNNPIKLAEFIRLLEEKMGKEAEKNYEPMKPEEVYKTWADCTDLYNIINFQPSTTLEEGIQAFVDWFRTYH